MWVVVPASCILLLFLYGDRLPLCCLLEGGEKGGLDILDCFEEQFTNWERQMSPFEHVKPQGEWFGDQLMFSCSSLFEVGLFCKKEPVS